ncbi:MAG: S8 family serine peptidase [Oricola sp.]
MPAVRNAPRIVAALLLSVAGAAGAQAQDTGANAASRIATLENEKAEQFFWRSEVLNKDNVQAELAKLYVTLNDNGVLETKSSVIEKGDTPTDLMIRAGAWPHWLENRMPQDVDAMLCRLNPDICKAVSDKSGAPVSDWSRAWPGRTIEIPDVALRLSYEVGIRDMGDPAFAKADVDVVATPDLAALWCRKAGISSDICAASDIDRGWANESPAIYQFVDDGRVDTKQFSRIASPTALKEFGAPSSPVKMVAVPVVEATIKTDSASLAAYTRTLKSLSQSVLVDQKLQLQSIEKENAAQFRRMGFVDSDGELVKPWKDGENLSPIVIAHFDAAADLNHCAFGPGVALKRWNFEKGELEDIVHPMVASANDGNPATSSTDTDTADDTSEPPAPACGALNAHPLVEKSHGTHTLGLLVDLLTLGGKIKNSPGNDQPAVTIIHIPSGLTPVNEHSLNALREVIGYLAWWDVKVVNMSVGWNRANTVLLDKSISDLGNRIIFVVAAGNDDLSDRCVTSPACIETANVISVVGLDTDPEQRLKILPGSNSGARFHDIGAIGANVVSTVDGNMLGPLSGTSQATPLVTVAVAHLIRRGKTSVDQIYERLMTTAVLDSDLLDASMATMVDLVRAMDLDHDFLELRDGCKMRGEFRDFTTNGDIVATEVEQGGLFYFASDDIRRYYYNEREDWHVLMHDKFRALARGSFQIEPDHLQREFRFRPDTPLENCDGVAAGAIAKFKLADVKDLIVASR